MVVVVVVVLVVVHASYAITFGSTVGFDSPSSHFLPPIPDHHHHWTNTTTTQPPPPPHHHPALLPPPQTPRAHRPPRHGSVRSPREPLPRVSPRWKAFGAKPHHHNNTSMFFNNTNQSNINNNFVSMVVFPFPRVPAGDSHGGRCSHVDCYKYDP